MNYYQTQAIQAAIELDHELELAAEAENTEVDSVQPDPSENSVYNFNAILDGLLD